MVLHAARPARQPRRRRVRRAAAWPWPASKPRENEIPIALTRRTSIVTERPGGGRLLRSLRVPEWPVVHDDDGDGVSRPALEVLISDTPWTAVEHLHGSNSFDLHYTAAADEDGSVWLGFGDGVRGREVPMATPGEPAVRIELRYRVGDAVAGNVGLGTLIDIVQPATGTDEQVSLEALGAVSVTNVVPASGGRAPHPLAREQEELPASLRHGPLQRAVALQDYATVAMQVPGVGRADGATGRGPVQHGDGARRPRGRGRARPGAARAPSTRTSMPCAWPAASTSCWPPSTSRSRSGSRSASSPGSPPTASAIACWPNCARAAPSGPAGSIPTG